MNFSMEKLFTVQSYDELNGIFFTADPETKENHFGCVWVTAPLTGIDNSGVTSIVSALSLSAKPGTMIQFGLLSVPDIEPALWGYRQTKVNSVGLASELVDRNVTFVRAGIDDPILKSSRVKLHKKQLIITFKEPTESFDEMRARAFCEQADRFSSAISASRIALTKLDASGYLRLARAMTHIFERTDDRYDPQLPINEQLFYSGDYISANKDRIEFCTGSNKDSNYFAKALSVKHFPLATSIGIMNNIIGSPSGIHNQITDPFYFVSTFVYSDQHKKKEYVKTKSTWINHQAVGPMGRLHKVKYRKQGIDNLVGEIDAGNAVVIDFNFTGWFFSKTEKELDECVESTRTYWDAIGLITKADSFILDPLWCLTFPLNGSVAAASGLNRFHSMTTNQGAQFLPLYGEATGPSAPSVLLVTRRGEIGGFDLFASDGNYNAIIAAASGSGKSFLTQRMIVDYLAQGAKVWVIDSGHSYKKLAMSLGDRASYIELDPAQPQIINPFSQFLSSRGGEEKNWDQEKSGLINIIERMASTRDVLNDNEIALLSEAMDSVFSQRLGHTCVRYIAEFLNAQSNPVSQRLGRSLYEFALGSYAGWFNGTSNVNLDNDFVVLELDNLKGDERLMTAVLSVLMNEINHEMYKSPDKSRKKILFVDEGWRQIKDPLMVKNINEAFRTVRKYMGSVVLITQDISDLYHTDESQSMMNNASWLMVLHQNESAINSAVKSGRLALDDYGLHLMKSLITSPGEYSDLMVINNGNYSLFRLIIDRFASVMFSTKGAERAEILAAIERGDDVVDAIEKFIVGESSYEVVDEIKKLVGIALDNGKNMEEVRRYLLSIV
jgi:conjugal transfer ATP-binding protein TraC